GGVPLREGHGAARRDWRARGPGPHHRRGSWYHCVRGTTRPRLRRPGVTPRRRRGGELMHSAEREASRRAWLDKVALVRETLVTHAEAAEREGRLATPVVDALHAAGFFNLKLPAELGGAEADPVLQLQVYEALSAIHPSAAWCAAIGAANAALTAPYLADAGAERLYGGGRTPLLASSVFPAGTATPVVGGYRVSGRWRFASGIHHADWVVAGATLTRQG